MAEEVKKIHIFGTQIFLVGALTIVTQNVNNDNVQYCLAMIARYVFYLLLIKGSRQACTIAYKRLLYKTNLKQQLKETIEENKKYLFMFTTASAILVYSRHSFFDQQFLWLSFGYLISQYLEMDTPAMINYGVGMACSYFEGYLVHVIPNDGGKFVGFQLNIQTYESRHKVVFPVKRLFIVITKSLYCPPHLAHFNKQNRPDLPHMEACASLEDVIKDVAGVRDRTYRNSAYKIHRPGKPIVYLAAEFATPLHTLHKVLEKRALYDKLCDVNPQEIVSDFCEQLEKTIERSPDCRSKCTLVHYDDTNPNENLADVLLNKIKEIEPDFEAIIERHRPETETQ